jgi:hypothetical protein
MYRRPWTNSLPRREPVTTSTPRLMSLIRKRSRQPSQIEPSHVPDPLSFSALLQRLATFKLTTYSPDKPRCIDAMAAARHGWINAGDDARERLWCDTCKQGWRIEPPRVPGGWRSEAGKGISLSGTWTAKPHARPRYQVLNSQRYTPSNCVRTIPQRVPGGRASLYVCYIV